MVAHSGHAWWVVRVTEWMSSKPEAATAAYGIASVLSGIFGIVVLSIVNGDLHGGWPSFGWVSWGPAGMALFLALVWLYDAFMLSLAAQAAFIGEHVWHLRSLPQYKLRLLALSSLHSHGGWFLLLFSGLPVARSLPSGLADILALWCLLNAAAHASVFMVVLRNRENAFFCPTEFSERSRDASLLGHALTVAFFVISALVAWFVANNPVVCDANADHHLSLGELTHCARLPGWIDGLPGPG